MVEASGTFGFVNQGEVPREPADSSEPEPPGATPPSPSMGRMHDRWWGQLLLTVLLGGLVMMLIGWNLPKSPTRSEFRDNVDPIFTTLGLRQGWEVFSPNPSSTSIRVEGRVTYDDGSVASYDFPAGDAFIGAFREYRWRKYERRVRLDRNRGLWRPTAQFIAREMAVDGKQVVEVVLVRHFSTTPKPGSGDERVWEQVDMYTLTVPPAGGAP